MPLKQRQQWRASRIIWCSSAIQVNSYYSIDSNPYLSCTNSYETYSAHFQTPKIVPSSNHHIKIFKEDIQTEGTVRWGYAITTCPETRAKIGRSRTNCSCSVSNLPWVGPLKHKTAHIVSPVFDLAVEKVKSKLAWRALTEFLWRNTAIENGLQVHFTKHLSASNFSAISSLEPGRDLNPAYRRTLTTLCELYDISVSCEVISLGSTCGERSVCHFQNRVAQN